MDDDEHTREIEMTKNEITGTIAWPQENGANFDLVYNPADGSKSELVRICPAAAKRIRSANIGDVVRVRDTDDGRFYLFRIRRRYA